MGRPKGSKNKTKKAASSGSRSKKNTYDAPMMGDEVAIIITFAVSAFLFLANLGLCGPVGALLKSVQLGLFGIMGFLFPIVLSFVVVFILSNLDNPYATFRMTTALFMLIFISAIFQLTFGGGVTNMSLLDFYKEGSQQGVGGGIIGGALAMVLFTIAGKVGSMLILLVACFICLIYITGKPLARMLAESSSLAALRATERAKEDWNNVTESARIHREERRQAREAQKRELAAKVVDFSVADSATAPQLTDGSMQQETSASENIAAIPEPDYIESYDDTYDAGVSQYDNSTESSVEADSVQDRSQQLLGPDEYASNTVELPLNVKHTPVTLVDPTTLPRPQVARVPKPSEAQDSIKTGSSSEAVSVTADTLNSSDEERDICIANASLNDAYDEVEAALNAAFDRMNRNTVSDAGLSDKNQQNESGYETDASLSYETDSTGISSENHEEVLNDMRVPHITDDSYKGLTITEISDDSETDPAPETGIGLSSTEAYSVSASETLQDSFESIASQESSSSAGTMESSYSDSSVSGSFENFDSDRITCEDLDDIYDSSSEASDFSGDSASDLQEDNSDGGLSAYSGDEGISIRSDGKAVIGRGDMVQGTREIVTASGQVIRANDVEPITKKIETQLEREKIANTPTEEDNKKVAQEITEKKPQKPYIIPPLSLLSSGGAQDMDTREEIRQNAMILRETLKSFDIEVTITDISVGPSVTRYELQPEIGVKVSKIVSLTDDIKMRLAATDIRIEAPIPGKSAIGIEVPNKHSSVVHLGDVLRSPEFTEAKTKIAFGVGKDIAGKNIVTDIAKMPHLLIAGSTGSGKSVCINTLIMSMLYKYKPEELRMIMVDPKVVELSVYNGIPHLLIPVVTDPKKAAAALNWAVAEMDSRYKKFAETGSRDLKGYNDKIQMVIDDPEIPENQKPEKLPQIVIIIDELADLMMVSSQEVEDAICRIAQLARAAGMHLVIATQRPTVNVITGLIKANVPSRIAFAVASGTDSRTIIDMNGAEKLLGKGDMLFFPQGIPKPVRVQGAFVSDQEVSAVTDFIKKTMGTVEYSQDIQAKVQAGGSSASSGAGQSDMDDLFFEAGQLIIESQKASIGMLQRKFRIGFNRAARIMDQLADSGVVGPEEGTKPRKILMNLSEFDSMFS